MKRLMLIVISGIFALVLTACGESGTKPEAGKTDNAATQPQNQDETKTGTEQTQPAQDQ